MGKLTSAYAGYAHRGNSISRNHPLKIPEHLDQRVVTFKTQVRSA